MTTDNSGNSELLEKVFHEPNRLSIMSVLCATGKEMSFNEIKDACNLTDGNLSRHLKALEESGVIAISKNFVDSKPRTTVTISSSGLERFHEYLTVLSVILNKAKKSLKPEKVHAPVISGRTARA
ncbi:MAG: transcriptional regulator [Victivallales bacterium]